MKRIADIDDLGKAIDIGVFQGRGEDLLSIHDWLVKPPPRGYLIRGIGGQGKSELAKRYALECLENGTNNVIGVSLYHAGGADHIIERIASALLVNVPSRSHERVLRIVEFCRSNDLLLIIDGLEREQEPSGAPPGAGLVPPGPLQDLLYKLMSPGTNARVLLTSQLDVIGVDPIGRIRRKELMPLSPEQGRDMLLSLGATEAEDVLKRVTIHLDGHPLSLVASAGILRKFGADDLVGLVGNVSKDKRVRRILLRYKDTLSKPGLNLLRIVCACNRSISEVAMQALLFKRPNGPLNWQTYPFSKKECIGLLWTDPNGQLDVHPIVRRVFQEEWLKSDQKQAKKTHELLAEFYEAQIDMAISKGDLTLADMESVVAAIHHRIAQGLVRKAFEIFGRYFEQGDKLYVVNNLGALDLALEVDMMFFHDRNPRRPRHGLDKVEVLVFGLNIAWTYLRLGRMQQAMLWGHHAREIGKKLVLRAATGGAVVWTFLWNQLIRAAQIYVEANGRVGAFMEAEREAKQALLIKRPDFFPNPTVLVRRAQHHPEVVDALVQSHLRAYSGRAQMWLGHFQAALLEFDAALKVVKESNPNQAFATGEINSLLWWAGMDQVECLLVVDRKTNFEQANEIHENNLRICTKNHWIEDIMFLRIEAAMLARLSGDIDGSRRIMDEIRAQIAASETPDQRMKFEIEQARLDLIFGDISKSIDHAHSALHLTNRIIHIPYRGDALCILAEAESNEETKEEYLKRLAEIVNGMRYGRRKRDLDLLQIGRRPVIEWGL